MSDTGPAGERRGSSPVGELVRQWRSVRGMSQLDLALHAGFSARHLSFIETGRAQPSREALLALAETLDVPLRERNRLLTAGGYAEVYRETPLAADEMAHIRNVHLLNIWREALLTLEAAAEWIFVGYSLPPDDIGIRALLLKARCMRHDIRGSAPRVTVVSGPSRRDETLARYRFILPQAILDPDDFGRFVRRATAGTA